MARCQPKLHCERKQTESKARLGVSPKSTSEWTHTDVTQARLGVNSKINIRTDTLTDAVPTSTPLFLTPAWPPLGSAWVLPAELRVDRDDEEERSERDEECGAG